MLEVGGGRLGYGNGWGAKGVGLVRARTSAGGRQRRAGRQEQQNEEIYFVYRVCGDIARLLQPAFSRVSLGVCEGFFSVMEHNSNSKGLKSVPPNQMAQLKAVRASSSCRGSAAHAAASATFPLHIFTFPCTFHGTFPRWFFFEVFPYGLYHGLYLAYIMAYMTVSRLLCYSVASSNIT